MIRVEHVFKSYAKGSFFKRDKIEVLRDVSLVVNDGEHVGIIGESGAGKSTLCRILSLLELPDKGSFYLDDKEISKDNIKKNRGVVGMVFQDPATSLDPKIVIKDTLTEAKRCSVDELEEWVGKVGLTKDVMFKKPYQLSGGQQQRVAIARTLISGARYVIFDEFTSALDVSTQAKIVNMLCSINDEREYSFVFVSHDVKLVGYLSDRIYVIYKGEVIEESKDIISLKHPYSKFLIEGKTSDITSNNFTNKEGCSFYNLCPYRRDICKRESPLLKKLDDGSYVRCFLYD